MRLKPVEYKSLEDFFEARPRIARESMSLHQLLGGEKASWPFSHAWEEDHEPITSFFIVFSNPEDDQDFAEIEVHIDLELGLTQCMYTIARRQ